MSGEHPYARSTTYTSAFSCIQLLYRIVGWRHSPIPSVSLRFWWPWMCDGFDSRNRARGFSRRVEVCSQRGDSSQEPRLSVLSPTELKPLASATPKLYKPTARYTSPRSTYLYQRRSMMRLNTSRLLARCHLITKYYPEYQQWNNTTNKKSVHQNDNTDNDDLPFFSAVDLHCVPASVSCD